MLGPERVDGAARVPFPQSRQSREGPTTGCCDTLKILHIVVDTQFVDVILGWDQSRAKPNQGLRVALGHVRKWTRACASRRGMSESGHGSTRRARFTLCRGTRVRGNAQDAQDAQDAQERTSPTPHPTSNYSAHTLLQRGRGDTMVGHAAQPIRLSRSVVGLAPRCLRERLRSRFDGRLHLAEQTSGQRRCWRQWLAQ